MLCFCETPPLGPGRCCDGAVRGSVRHGGFWVRPMVTQLINRDPAHVTGAIWWFWVQAQKLDPAHMRLGGIYAKKPGYHNMRKALPRSDYSVKYFKDMLGPDDKAAAIDISFTDAQQRGDFRTIAKYSTRLYKSGRDLRDERGNYLREFFGNTDTDRQVEGWDFQKVCPSTSPDNTHIWHIHLSWMRAYVNDYKAMRAVLSILAGESVATWRKKEAALAKAKR